MPPAIIGGVIAGVGALGGAAIMSGASSSAANTQAAANSQAIAEQQRQFDQVQKLLAPYVSAGNTGLSGILSLSGLSGTSAQQSAVSQLENSATFQALARQGEQGILQNASATGGLRGGNTQGALAQFRPALLNQQIQQQMSTLNNLASLGQNAAAGTGNAGLSTSNTISNLLQDTGSAQAAGSLASSQAWGNALGSVGSSLGGMFAGSPSIPKITPEVLSLSSQSAIAANPSIF